ncbi:MAG: hypothetical protein ACRDSH_13705 [Pseudonocardiaceae bacterium]
MTEHRHGAGERTPLGDSAGNALMRAGDGADLPRSPVIGVSRFARSTRDRCVHVLMPAGAGSADGHTARCGHVLPAEVIVHDQPPPGAPCELCRLMFLEDFTADGSSRTTGPTH